jgi:hypothetical protein
MMVVVEVIIMMVVGNRNTAMLVYQVLRTCGVQLLPLPHKAELQSNLY